MASNGRLVVEEMDITPEMAKRWISATGNKNFRSPTTARVNAIVRDIRNGDWQLNGETIKLAGDVCKDGLHRLTAIVVSGSTVRSLVVRNIPDEFDTTVDRGRPRSLAQEMSYRRVPSAKNTATVTRQWYQLRDGQWGTASSDSSGASDSVLWKFFEDHRERIQDAVSLCTSGADNMRVQSFVSVAVCGPLICEGTIENFHRPRESSIATNFTMTIATGNGSGPDDPAVVLRNRMIKDQRTKTQRMDRVYRRAITIYAWNLFCEGQVASTLRYRLSGPSAQQFPDIAQATE